jgi:hypothetical protein
MLPTCPLLHMGCQGWNTVLMLVWTSVFSSACLPARYIVGTSLLYINLSIKCWFRLHKLLFVIILLGAKLRDCGLRVPYLLVQQRQQVVHGVGVRPSQPPHRQQVRQPLAVRTAAAATAPSGLCSTKMQQGDYFRVFPNWYRGPGSGRIQSYLRVWIRVWIQN